MTIRRKWGARSARGTNRVDSRPPQFGEGAGENLSRQLVNPVQFRAAEVLNRRTCSIKISATMYGSVGLKANNLVDPRLIYGQVCLDMYVLARWTWILDSQHGVTCDER